MTTVFRVEKTGNYTVMSNVHLDDRALSYKAKGLLSCMLRAPEDWDYTLEGLAELSTDGVDAVRSAVNELERGGYLSRNQSRVSGRFGTNEYIVRETPVLDFPASEKPLSENPTTVTIKKPNTTPLKPPQGGESAAGAALEETGEGIASGADKPKRRGADWKETADWKPERFEGFWRTYPRGEGRQKAIRAWDKLRPDDETIDAMGRGLLRQMDSEDWQRGIGIPYASTWLNQRRWTDEVRGPVQGAVPGGWVDSEVI